MKKNETITLEITSVANSGYGLGRYGSGGIVVFVPYSAIGDVLLVKILKVNASYAYGKISEIITPSASRILPDCAAFGKCGGCDFRHISYDLELKIKEGFIKDAFQRSAGISPEFLPIIPNIHLSEYRNKVQYPVGKNKENKAFYGFYRTNSHDIVECNENNCVIGPKIFSEIADFVIKFVNENKISVYNETEHKGVLRHIYLRKGHYSGEICLTLTARRRIPEFYALAKAVVKTFSQVKGVVLNINKDKTNVILGSGNDEILVGTDKIIDRMCGLEIEISPKSFYQINTPAAERIYDIAREFVEPGGKKILDLYCGAGTIGLYMAIGEDKADAVTGIEVEAAAIKNAEANAARNNITNARFICTDAEKGVTALVQSGEKIDAVILDPSRKGCEGETVKQVARLNPNRIVMISCNPVTAARDCGKFNEYGYRTLKVQGADLFSRTKHVECVCLLTRTEV